MVSTSSHSFQKRIVLAAVVPFVITLLSFASTRATAQDATQPILLAEASSSSLPEAPVPNNTAAEATPNAPLSAAPEPAAPQPAPTAPTAKVYAKFIPAGWQAQPITAHDKVILGLRDTYSPFSFLGYIASAGYSHITNGQPNYGVDKGAFGQRLGATVIRDASEGVFVDSVFSPLLHEDPRYYVEGSHYNLVHRFFYSITRPIITRTDSGRETVNAAELMGYAAGSAISYTYYPKINQNFRDTVATFGGSLAGAAVGDFVSEFADQVLVALHLEKKQ
jgi:hypothetical protein